VVERAVRALRREYRNGNVSSEFDPERPGFVRSQPPPVVGLATVGAVPTAERTTDGTTEYVLEANNVTNVLAGTDHRIRRTGPGRVRAILTEDGFVRSVTTRAPIEIGNASGRFVHEDEYELRGIGRPSGLGRDRRRPGGRRGNAPSVRTPSDS
jgi:hypothetical protein